MNSDEVLMDSSSDLGSSLSLDLGSDLGLGSWFKRVVEL